MATSDTLTGTLRVLLLSRYSRLVASSRVRSYQYLPYLSQLGIVVERESASQRAGMTPCAA